MQYLACYQVDYNCIIRIAELSASTPFICIESFQKVKYLDMHFDLISDLHLDLWKDNIKDWRGITTSLTCIVAGDVSRDVTLTTSFLKHLSKCYQQVLFVDGNHEHYRNYAQIEDRQSELEEALSSIDNLTYLSDSALVIDNTAIIGSNGWWTFDYPEKAGAANKIECMDAFCAKEDYSMRDAINIWTQAEEQASFLCDVVASLQDNDDVNDIIIVTHTVPRNDLMPRCGDLVDWAKTGNSSMKDVLSADINGKISTWCFGHIHTYHVDTRKDGIRYVSHPRGRPNDAIFPTYYPKRIDTELNSISQF